MLPQKEIGGLIPTIQKVALENIKLNALIAEKEAEMKESPLYLEIQSLKTQMSLNEKIEEEARQKGKDMMIENGLKEFQMLDGTIIQLNKTPGALVIEEGAVFDDKYYRVKKEIDKTAIKKDFNAGLPISGCYIQSDYKFIIKNK